MIFGWTSTQKSSLSQRLSALNFSIPTKPLEFHIVIVLDTSLGKKGSAAPKTHNREFIILARRNKHIKNVTVKRVDKKQFFSKKIMINFLFSNVSQNPFQHWTIPDSMDMDYDHHHADDFRPTHNLHDGVRGNTQFAHVVAVSDRQTRSHVHPLLSRSMHPSQALPPRKRQLEIWDIFLRHLCPAKSVDKSRDPGTSRDTSSVSMSRRISSINLVDDGTTVCVWQRSEWHDGRHDVSCDLSLARARLYLRRALRRESEFHDPFRDLSSHTSKWIARFV